MYRLITRKWQLAALLLSSALLFACSGDTGPTGPAGGQGAAGPPGPGIPGPSGSSTVPVESAEKINVAIQSVTVPAGGGAPTVELRLSNDLGFGLSGLPASAMSFALAQLSPGQNGGSSEWQSYVTRGPQASTESAGAGTFADNGDGTYTYTFAQALTAYADGPVFSETNIHRLGVEIRTNRYLPENIPANNAPYDFLPTGGAVNPDNHRLIVNNDTCNACHDNLELHGEARFDVEYCVTCHNPYSIDPDTAAEPWGGSVDMKVMIHKIHYGVNLTDGYSIEGYGGTLHDYSNIVFPQDVRNCTTCHQESDTTIPQASNWRAVQNRAACGTCHDDIDWDAGGHPGGFVFTDDTQCALCHGETQGPPDLQVATVHQIPEAEAAKAFEYDVVSVAGTAPGDMPTVRVRVLNPTDPNYATDPASTAYDINDVNSPFQVGSSRLRVDIAWNDNDFGNVDPNDTLARSPTSGAPFAPIAIDFQTGAVNVGNNVFEKQSSDAIPTGVTGSGAAILEGRPQVDLGEGLVSLSVVGNGLSFAITDTAPQDRRSVVAIEKCNDCHETLALHGDNRVGNTELCSTCHNPNATDVQQRGVADTDCFDDLGSVEESIDMKRMIHRIHAGNVGICGYRNSSHDYNGVVYPGRLNNCEGCHVKDDDGVGTYYPVDPTAVLATTIHTGDDRSSLVDDVAISPNSSVCSSCHTSDLAKNHMTQNGGDFDADKDDTGAMISTGNETCQLCHGPGASADVGELHGVGGFRFN
jgi:OmcA/MtrC family decaheme c-type cytochrome